MNKDIILRYYILLYVPIMLIDIIEFDVFKDFFFFIYFEIIIVLYISDHHIMTSFSNQNNASAFPLINSKLYFVTELVIGQSAALM